MGSISTGIGLISGIDTASLIEQLLAISARPKFRLQGRIAELEAQRTAMLDINARLLNLKSTAEGFRSNNIFSQTLGISNNENILTVATGSRAQPGTFKFIVKDLVSTSQKLSKGFVDTETTPLGLDKLSFEFGNGLVARDRDLVDLNAGDGVQRGRISITDADSNSAEIDLTDVISLNEVIDRINEASGIGVTASVGEDGIVLTDTSGGAGMLTVANLNGVTTADDLGLTSLTQNGSVYTGETINTVGGNTLLSSLNDGNGVLIVDSNPDFTITAKNGRVFNIDLGRIDAPITTDTLLSELNNGGGIEFTAGETDLTITVDGTAVDINLGDVLDDDDTVLESAVTTVGELFGRVNSALADEGFGTVDLTLNADGTGFDLVDSNGIATLQVSGAGVNGTETAEDLGIFNGGAAATGTIVGATIPNAVETPRALTLQDVIDRINNAQDTGDVDNGGAIVASIGADGVSLTVTDATGGGGNLTIAASVSNAHAAEELGLVADTGGTQVQGERLIASLGSVLLESLNGGDGLTLDGLEGGTPLSALLSGAGITTNNNAASPDIQVTNREGTSFFIEVDGLTTVQEFLDAANAATGGTVEFRINNNRFEAEDLTTSFLPFTIADANGASVASELGIAGTMTFFEGNTFTGVDTDPQLDTFININNRDGLDTQINIAGLHSLSQVIDAINTAGAGVTASVNSNGTGLLITDTTGGTGNLTIDGDAATRLGITADVATDEIQGTNLQLQYVSEGTALSDLNYGRGVGTGAFRITDGYGISATVSIGSDSVTLQDVIAEINSRGLAIIARVNDNGDGLIIEEDPDAIAAAGNDPFVPIKVEAAGGTTAADLNILGESSTVTGASIDGSYEIVVDLETTDSLADVIFKINESGAPVSASVLNTGSGATPYRLNQTYDISEASREMLHDTFGVNLGFTTLSEGRDARVFFGGDSPETGFLITSDSNTLDDVIQDVTIDLLRADVDEVVTVTIERDTASIVEAAKQLAVNLNDAVATIDNYDFFNTETEERGVLLGDSTVSRVRNALFLTLRSPARNIDTQYTLLSQVGFRVGSDSTVTLDEAKFLEAFNNDPQAVENLFAAFESSTSSSEEIARGITVNNSSTTTSSAGIGEIFGELLEGLTNSIDGTLELADQRFEDQIDNTEDRIAIIDQRLERQRERLQREFAAMELALARLQGQSNALLSFNV